MRHILTWQTMNKIGWQMALSTGNMGTNSAIVKSMIRVANGR